MIVSASRRTDIPALFPQWFAQRVREGFVRVANPFNAGQGKEHSLRPGDVDAVVFWSKNPGPLIPYLDELDRMGLRYYFQFTLNGYPTAFEPRMPPLEERLRTFRALSDRLGPARVVWRYDPIIVSSATPAAYHLERIETIAKELTGRSERLVISFMDFYRKTYGRLRRLSDEQGIRFTDIALPEHARDLLDLASRIAEIGSAYGYEVTTCAEAADLSSVGIRPGACIDGALIRRLSGVNRSARKDKGQRPECGCAESVDIGTYNTCSLGCAYCYAYSTPSRKAVLNSL